MHMNKKGTAMAEAAIVFPLVILCAAALIQILVFFYQVTQTNVNMHLALRAECGTLSKTVGYEGAGAPPYPICRSGNHLYYSARLPFLGGGILQQAHKDISARQYVYRGMTIVRTVDFAQGMADKE